MTQKTTIFKVFHNTFGDVMRHVATIELENESYLVDNCLDTVYELTNTINDCWVNNGAVTCSDDVLEKGGCRSTSMGDIIQVFYPNSPSVHFYEVDAIGFKKLDPQEDYPALYAHIEKNADSAE